MTESGSEVKTDLCEYLKKLGLDVIADAKGLVQATRRTALNQETMKFKVSDHVPDKLPKKTIHIVPDSVRSVPDAENLFRYGDFLDRTVQADLICRRILEDRGITDDVEHFVPQHITVDGQSQPEDAPTHVAQWLDRGAGGLLVVLAPAGYGKTVLTRVTSRRLADAHMAPTNGQPNTSAFPFLIPFGEFRRVASFESMIVTALHRAGVTDVTAAAFAHLVARQRCVLLLDGFDELLEERPEEARKNLRELIETLRGAGRVMVTARATFFRTSTDVADFLENGIPVEDVSIVDLRPFDASQRRTLVAKLADDQKTITYINQILEMEGVSEAMGSPLLLKETIQALADPDVRKKVSARTKRSDLFTVLEASVYARERQRHGHHFPDRVQASFVAKAAEEMLRGNARGFDSELFRVLALEAADAFNFEAPETDFAQLADHHFLTVDHASHEVRFNHQVFREYFQAKAMHAAVAGGDRTWVRAVLVDRPLPEEVARFFAEIARNSTAFEDLCELASASAASRQVVQNLALLCQAFGTRDAVQSLLDTIGMAGGGELRLDGVNLEGFLFGERIFDRLELCSCNCEGCDFSGVICRELFLSGTRLVGAQFSAGSPEVLQIEYGQREFDPGRIAEALTKLGVVGLEQTPEEIAESRSDWRDETTILLASRLKRFHSGKAGETHLWDTSISERNLLGGLSQTARHTASELLIPAMLKHGVITKHREHHNIIYRLTEAGKTDARALLAAGESAGTVLAVIDVVAPATTAIAAA